MPPGSAFSAAGHFPVLAGRDEYEREEYLAVVRGRDEEAERSGIAFCTVCDGVETARFWDADDSMHETEHFMVLALRFDAGDYDRRLYEVLESDGGVDPTGPVYWRRAREVSDEEEF